jgi:hypothetical protein
LFVLGRVQAVTTRLFVTLPLAAPRFFRNALSIRSLTAFGPTEAGIAARVKPVLAVNVPAALDALRPVALWREFLHVLTNIAEIVASTLRQLQINANTNPEPIRGH